jgi:hypothetical protein
MLVAKSRPLAAENLHFLAYYDHDKAQRYRRFGTCFRRVAGGWRPADDPALAQAGTGKSENQIITTRQQVVDSIYRAVDSCFDDWHVSGPKPPEIIVSRLVAEVLEGVSRQASQAHETSCREPR